MCYKIITTVATVFLTSKKNKLHCYYNLNVTEKQTAQKG